CQANCPVSDTGETWVSDTDISEFKSQLVKIKTKADQGKWLIYSDANLPTWEAYIGGQETQIYTANYLFKSVFIPEGEHEVVFKYPGLWRQFKYAFKNLISNF
ncbi:MAG TPA: YfhO family protein, partial [Candidatus Paceibacterota bacterium]